MMKEPDQACSPLRATPFAPYNSIGSEEEAAAVRVIRSGQLSSFIARGGESFYGGREVQRLERLVEETFGVKHAVSMNSATSCLYAAMGALGLGPGDEVIVSPYSHCISATAPLLYGAVPVFADLEDDCYCLSLESIRRSITPRTKAVIAVDTFGQSSDMDGLMALAHAHNLKVVCDAAHSFGAKYRDKWAGTVADIGVFSLNGYKIIQVGEGGIAVTNDDEMALRLALIRNHAEACVADLGVTDITNLLGQNYRLGEIEAAMAVEQIKKLPGLIAKRVELAEYLSERLRQVPGITPPAVRPGNTHAYYLYPIAYDESVVGMQREEFVEGLRGEGIPLYRMAGGYVRPLYLLPIFAQRKYAPYGYPWESEYYDGHVDYAKVHCPVTQRLYEKELIVNHLVYPPLTRIDMDDIVAAFVKVSARRRRNRR